MNMQQKYVSFPIHTQTLRQISEAKLQDILQILLLNTEQRKMPQSSIIFGFGLHN